MTPAEQVRARYPKAYAYRFAGPSPWVIYSGEAPVNRTLNVSDKSRRAAWAAAAEKIHATDSRVTNSRDDIGDA